MTVRYDDKGKFFTDIVTKDTISVVIQTLMHRVEGLMYIRPDQRIKDELNKDVQFFAVTDAVVYNSQNKKLYDSEFLLINSDHIVWMIPTEEYESSDRSE
jgi:hypothetical protein